MYWFWKKQEHLIIFVELLVLFFLIGTCLWEQPVDTIQVSPPSNSQSETDYIKWVDFDITASAMNEALRYDMNTFQSDIHVNWIELLAMLGVKYGGDFSNYEASDMAQLVSFLEEGCNPLDLVSNSQYYNYYLEAYTAILGGMVGIYEVEIPQNETETTWVKKYGLYAFSPIAKNFPFQDYDDFGVSRSYGFQRQHLGHDLMGQTGTPIIAIESGYIEALGWNEYGGWRIGIRSFDKMRYYYYAHLRQNYPYQSNLEIGSIVKAGDVIGYLGHTGYSAVENTNNIEEPHLHLGLQLIFDESQKDGDNQIWIDCYELTKFLQSNQSLTIKNSETKEWSRIYDIKIPTISSGNH